MKCDFNKRQFIARSLFYYVYILCLFYVYVCVLCELFFIYSVVLLLSCVNVCAFHMYFTVNLLLLLTRQ